MVQVKTFEGNRPEQVEEALNAWFKQVAKEHPKWVVMDLQSTYVANDGGTSYTVLAVYEDDPKPPAPPIAMPGPEVVKNPPEVETTNKGA